MALMRILARSLAFFLVSCSSYHDEYTEQREYMMHVSLSPLDASCVDVRTALETNALEDKISHATVCAYDKETGRLAAVVHSASEPVLTLAVDRMYDVYVIANMGDLSESIPVCESDMETFKCVVPSSDNMKARGLPMAGMASSACVGNVTVKVRRLVAKLNIIIDHSEMDSGGADMSFCNTAVKVHRAANVVRPFADGGSAAESADEINPEVYDCQVVVDGYADLSEEITLYVPENMQGNLLSGNLDPWEKSESSDVSLCTYISMEGVKDGAVDGVEGDFVYRFFPGTDDVRNFDLQGNKVYDISLVLTWDGMYVEDSWKVEKSNWSDSRRLMVSLSEDRGYASKARLDIVRGSSDVPVYICYSPSGMPYESEGSGGEAHHLNRGWIFMPLYPLSDGAADTSPKPNDSEFIGTYMSTGFVGHSEYRTIHYVTVPETTPAGYSNRIVYRTADGRRNAWLDIHVVDSPDLSIDDEEDGGGGDIEY